MLVLTSTFNSSTHPPFATDAFLKCPKSLLIKVFIVFAISISLKKKKKQHKQPLMPWQGGQVGWSIVLMHQGCRFGPWSGHIQESTNEGMDKWNKLMFLSLGRPL